MGHQQTVAALAWSPSGVLLASGSYDETIHLWSAGDESLRPSGDSN
jgi:WD40 repeat protein